MITAINITLNDYEGYEGDFDEDSYHDHIESCLSDSYPHATVQIYSGSETHVDVDTDGKGEGWEAEDARQEAMGWINETDPFCR